MATSIDTDELRKSAPEWNLEGDRKLLNLLQNIHQNITARCTETGTRLGDMFASLDHAKVSMDNVNNRFMSLSNTQFVESRVYEEDPEFKTPPLALTQPNPESANKGTPLQQLTAALLSIESHHERVTILEDSESDTDDEGVSVILRPKDVYQNRPLPFIIGSQSWKSKWHAGLIAEDSDTESMISKKDEDLSESEESVAMSSAPNIHADANSFRSVSPASLPAQDDLYKPDMSRKYQPYAAANTAPQPYIFVDEPPPMPNDSDSTTDHTESDTDDIFAELHKDTRNKSLKTNINTEILKNNSQKTHIYKENLSNVDKKDMFTDYREISPESNKELRNNNQRTHINSEIQSNVDTKDRSIDNRERMTPDDDKMSYHDDSDTDKDSEIDRKPTGAVSLFGTKSVAKSIGAAILKRNQRKSTSSEDDDEKTNNQAKTTQFNQNINKNMKENKNSIINDDKTSKERVKNTDINDPAQNVIEQIVNRQSKGSKQVVVSGKNIFDELFAKSKQNLTKTKEETVNVKKVDVFSDIFDDIDDLFTSDVKIGKSNSKNTKKSIFDDDLFSDSVKSDVQDEPKLTKSIFDDENDLFNEPVITTQSRCKEKSQKNISNDKITTKEVESFKNVAEAVLKTDDSSKKSTLFSKGDSDMFKNNAKEAQNSKTLKNPKENKKTTSIFDSDIDGDDIFSVIKAPALKKSEIPKTNTFGEFSNAADNSSLLNDHLPSASKSNLNFMIKNTESSNNNESIKNKFDDINEDGNENLFKKGSSKITSQDFDTESDKSITNTNTNTLKTTKTKHSQINNDKLDQNFVIEEVKQCESVKINEEMKVETKLNNEPAVTSGSDIHTANKNNSKQISSNEGKHSQNIDTENITLDSNDVTKENKHNTFNDMNTSDIPKADNVQSNITKHITKHIDVKDSQIDIFEDIFPEEPPELEKAKETKSNQNVNALFGDDSEDENLFFKKETLISDEKPETSQVTPIDPLFGVFTDEPPDLDDDFLFKTPAHSSEGIKKAVDEVNTDDIPKAVNIQSNITKPIVGNKGFLLSDGPKTNNTDFKDQIAKKDKESKDVSIHKNRSIFNDDDVTSLFSAGNTDRETLPKPTKTAIKNISIFDDDNDSLLSMQTKQDPTKESTKNQEETDGNHEPKSIGKLKPINFNIDVTNLLPGASPKKIVKPDPSRLPIDESSTDGGILTKSANETVSTKTTNTTSPIQTTVSTITIKDSTTKNFQSIDSVNTENAITEPLIVKSVSFDSDPESAVLDTKISKQRARIQVKRRPSTRRARKDAARKSVIDLDIDTVDSKFENDEDLTPKTVKDRPLVDSNLDNISIKTAEDLLTSSFNDEDQSINSSNQQSDGISKGNDVKRESSFERSVNSYVGSIENMNTKKDLSLITELNLKHERTLEKAETNKDVYKNIGRNSPENSLGKYMEQDSPHTHKDGTQVLNINEDDIYIFREPKATKTELVETKITTLGQVYPEHTAKDISKTEKDKQRSIFDDDDDLIFSVSNTDKETTKSAFNSTLFSQTKTKNLHNTKSVIEDDEDIFSTGNTNEEFLPKSTKSRVKPSIFDEENKELFPSTSNTKPPKKSIKKSLFDDLSDDDNDLFGGKSKTTTKTVNTSSDDLFSSKDHKIEAKTVKSTLFDEDTGDIFGSSSKGHKETKTLPLKTAVPKDTVESTETFEDPLSLFSYD